MILILISISISISISICLLVTYYFVQNEGLIGMYKGLGPNYLKVIPSVSISYLVYENVKTFLSTSDVWRVTCDVWRVTCVVNSNDVIYLYFLSQLKIL